MKNNIEVRGAREHNLKNIDVDIPKNQLVVITGLSGSGKSSLAFDTIYAEGHRRYVESLSAYARQFLGLTNKPDVDSIEGLSPAISIDQKSSGSNPRSTVGTVTEIYDYLRLLYARVGIPHDPTTGEVLERQSIDQIVPKVMDLRVERALILAPVVVDKKGRFEKELADLRKGGFVRVQIDGSLRNLDEEIELDKNKKHTIDVIVDRLNLKSISHDDRARLVDSLETALRLADGKVKVTDASGEGEWFFSEKLASAKTNFSMPELEPRLFSFNSPHGACKHCSGLGTTMELNPDLLIPNKNLSISEGAVRPWGANMTSGGGWNHRLLMAVAKQYGFDLDAPVAKLKARDLNILLNGAPDDVVVTYKSTTGRENEYKTHFEGVIPNLMRRYKETDSEYIRSEIEKYMEYRICPECHGARLQPAALAVTVGNKSIVEVASLPIREAVDFFNGLELTEQSKLIAKQILKEITERLGFLKNVGLEYLTLDRTASTLSGGEAQRIRLATQIGSGLSGVVYILDEPSIGLHQHDNKRLIETLERLRDLGNTVLVVEHDEETINSADWVIDVGPLAGKHGGELVAAGTPQAIAKSSKSLTGQYLSGKKRIEIPKKRRQPNGKWLKIVGASEFNLKDIDVGIPLQTFVCVTGLSGSGKSTLINEILAKKLARDLHGAYATPGAHKKIEGVEHLDKAINIDQSPIGRSPRSNPATYTGVFTYIRELFAALPESKQRGYKIGRFSFNAKGGRCEHCHGDGVIKIEMHFLPDVYVPCSVCHGRRYNSETLQVKYKGKDIADVLDMTVNEGAEFFANIPRIKTKLDTLQEVGLGYIKLGQPATQLSGGEAQRVKLATELSRKATGKTLYILDEPTTGLHFEDINKLLAVLHKLVDKGNTVLVIEHNLDVIKTADWIIDLGPEGGNLGGEVVAEGTPEEIVKSKQSYTGQYLKKLL
ncbi:MAG: excinuclease ABC subunit UvrA [Patescibacteria group bacterium]|nr:excinuclease ABC subunit UvrA [Patescibacteria group bacterium]